MCWNGVKYVRQGNWHDILFLWQIHRAKGEVQNRWITAVPTHTLRFEPNDAVDF